MDIREKYELWLNNAVLDGDLIKELKTLSDEQINDAFYRDLEFGTGGLRGIIGAGTNRMNVYTVAKATQGLANYLISHVDEDKRSVALSRDSRLKSDLFVEITARVLSANGIKVYMYPYISPVPTLSFATRKLHCAMGIMITASHNPSKYNGYKVYGSDGCQITTAVAEAVLKEIDKVDVFNDVKMDSFDDGFAKKLISYIEPNVITDFIGNVKNQSLLFGKEIDKSVSIVYTPLNGTGLLPIKRALSEMGYTNVIVVKEQELPNGYFPTCSYPNPEIRETLKLGIEYCKQYNGDILVATDPDCDRVGIAVKNAQGEYVLLSGNETGLLLFDYICSRRIENHTMPKNPTLVKTIVSSDIADKMAKDFGVNCINVLTGFKFIGEQIGFLEKQNRADDYIFGFEESYGYLTGNYVRDKDGVNGATMIVEMFAYYHTFGISLLDKLEEIYQKYGHQINTLHNYEFYGQEGLEKMQKITDYFRSGLSSVGDYKICDWVDYGKGIDNLPKSNVIKLYFENFTAIVRPSGTEPKLKLYLSVSANSKEESLSKESEIAKTFDKIING